MAVALFIMFGLFGCASTVKYAEEGRKFSLNENFKVELDKTRKEAILSQYGQPTSTHIVGKYEVLSYAHLQKFMKSPRSNPLAGLVPGVAGVAVLAAEYLNLALSDSSDTIEWEVMVIYTDLVSGVVKDYYYHDYHDGKFKGHDESESLYLVGSTLLAKGQKIEDAIKLLEQSISLNSNNHRALNMLAWQLIDTGNDVEKGVRYAQKAVDIFPDSPYNNGTLGIGCFKKGDFVNAEKYLNMTIELFPIYAHSDYNASLRLYNDALQRYKAFLAEVQKQKKN